jgi:hypothetical protein
MSETSKLVTQVLQLDRVGSGGLSIDYVKADGSLNSGKVEASALQSSLTLHQTLMQSADLVGLVDSRVDMGGDATVPKEQMPELAMSRKGAPTPPTQQNAAGAAAPQQQQQQQLQQQLLGQTHQSSGGFSSSAGPRQPGQQPDYGEEEEEDDEEDDIEDEGDDGGDDDDEDDEDDE